MKVTQPGLQTLNGMQATAYCRIRATAGDDFRRAERQRTVPVSYTHLDVYKRQINNLGVSEASGEYVLLLNNDTQVITVNWMEELLMYAQREDVGAVGGKLYYARCV